MDAAYSFNSLHSYLKINERGGWKVFGTHKWLIFKNFYWICFGRVKET